MTHGIKTIDTTAAELVMRLLIIGATGGTGLQVTRQAVEGGHNVTASVGLRRNSAHCVSAWWSVRVTHAASPICGTCFPVTTP